MRLFSCSMVFLSLIVAHTSNAQNWDVMEKGMLCNPVFVSHKEGCDSWLNGIADHQPMKFIDDEIIFQEDRITSSALQNDCFRTIWDHLKVVDGRVYKKIIVHMDQFGDMAIAGRLVEIAQAGAKVSIILNSYKGTLKKYCSNMVLNKFVTAAKKISKTCKDCLVITPEASHIKLHQKFLFVQYKEGGKTHNYILNGSYNFTVMAWRDKVESLTVLHQASDVTVAQEDWQVVEPYLICDGNGNSSYRIFQTPAKTTPGFNECYHIIMGLFDLTTNPTRVFTSVKVDMGYFEDNTIAQAIAAIGQKFADVVAVNGDISQLEKEDTSQVTKTNIATVQATLVSVTPTWYTAEEFTKTFHVSGDYCEYHPKRVRVTYTQKEVDGKTYQYKYILNGSYNFTPSAKTFNQEAITLLRKRVQIADVEHPAKDKSAIAVDDVEALPLKQMTIGGSIVPSKSAAIKTTGVSKKSKAPSASKADDEMLLLKDAMPLANGEETWPWINKTTALWDFGAHSFPDHQLALSLLMTLVVAGAGS